MDVLASRDWNSTQIQVAGLRLGMSREESRRVILGGGLRLLQYGPRYEWVNCSDARSCFVAGSKSDRYEGLTIWFGGSEAIERIDIQVDLDVKSDLVAKCTGETRRFLSGKYSDGLRLSLFGPESRTEMVSGRFGDRLKDVTYFYSGMGVVITISPDVNAQAAGIANAFELTNLSFVPPS